jgi:hypothetical protein
MSDPIPDHTRAQSAVEVWSSFLFRTFVKHCYVNKYFQLIYRIYNVFHTIWFWHSFVWKNMTGLLPEVARARLPAAEVSVSRAGQRMSSSSLQRSFDLEFLWVSMSFYEFLGLPLPLSWHVLACVWDPKVIIECPWNSSGLTRVKLLGFAKRQEPERHCFFVEMKSQQNFLWRASDIMYRCKISFWGRRQMPRQSVPQSDSWC